MTEASTNTKELKVWELKLDKILVTISLILTRWALSVPTLDSYSCISCTFIKCQNICAIITFMCLNLEFIICEQMALQQYRGKKAIKYYKFTNELH